MRRREEALERGLELGEIRRSPRKWSAPHSVVSSEIVSAEAPSLISAIWHPAAPAARPLAREEPMQGGGGGAGESARLWEGGGGGERAGLRKVRGAVLHLAPPHV